MKRMFRCAVSALYWTTAVLAAAPAALAQDDAAGDEDASARAPEPVEEIIVIGPNVRRDRAMDAFLKGDFEIAEIEFGKNVRCVQRLESQRKWAVEMAANAADLSLMVSPTYQGPSAGPTKTPKRTCEDEAYQLYMQGLSLLQLGRYAEAKRLFYRVITLRKDLYAYDVHYRIGLLEVVAGDLRKAGDRLSHLKTLQKRCARIRDKCEIVEEIDESILILASAIDNYGRTASG